MSSDQTAPAATSDLKNALGIDAQIRSVQDIPADVIELVRQRCSLTHDQINDVIDAIKSGVGNAAEYFGVTPAIANAIESMALEFYRQKHVLYANSLYAFLVEVDRNRSTAWRGMGACHQVGRLYPLAVLCYQQAIFLDPNDVISTVFLGECLFIDGWRDEGIRTLQRAVAMGSSIPAHALYVKRAQNILTTQAGLAAAAVEPAKKKGDSQFDVSEPVLASVPAQADADALAMGEINVEALLAMDNLDFAKHPKIQELAQRLSAKLQRREITYKDVAGFTDEQMYGGYAAACRLIDAGKPLTALEVMGWMLYFDGRNGSYYQVAGLAAHHAKLYCFADYLYSLSLIYEPNNPVTMLYQGEVKIYSFERHGGVELLRKAVDMLGHDSEQRHLVKRGKALIKQFEKKPVSQQTAKGVGSK